MQNTAITLTLWLGTKRYKHTHKNNISVSVTVKWYNDELSKCSTKCYLHLDGSSPVVTSISFYSVPKLNEKRLSTKFTSIFHSTESTKHERYVIYNTLNHGKQFDNFICVPAPSLVKMEIRKKKRKERRCMKGEIGVDGAANRSCNHYVFFLSFILFFVGVPQS